MEGSLTASDVMALSKGNEGFIGDGIWGIIMLLIIAGIFTGNGFGFGNKSGVTEEYIANQFSQRDLYNNNTNILTSASETQKEVLENRYANQLAIANNTNEILNNRYENALAIAGLQKDVLLGNQTMQAQMASCCCDIKSLVRDEAQGIKDLINNNTIQSLRDQLNLAEMAAANGTQTQNLLNTMGTWRANPSYSSCSCGY